jgi:hypothetical protein
LDIFQSLFGVRIISDYPSIDTCTRRDVRVREHPFDIPSVDFNYQIPDADKVKAKSSKGAVEAIDFEFWLRVSGLSFIEVIEQNQL